jgi:hypothetical protein
MLGTTFSKIILKNSSWGYKNLFAQMKHAVAFERQGGSAVEMLKSYCAIAQKVENKIPRSGAFVTHPRHMLSRGGPARSRLVDEAHSGSA